MSNAPQTDEVPDGSTRPSVFTKNRIALVLLLLAHAMIGAYCTPSTKTLSDLTAGIRFSQPILLASWAVLARQSFYYRLLWALLICTYLSFADDLGVTQQMQRTRPAETIVANLSLFVASLPILLLVRSLSGWRITGPAAQEAEPAYRSSHYGIHHLMILTAIVALACGLVRSLLIMQKSGFPYPSLSGLVVIIGLNLYVLFPVCVVPWLTLAEGQTGHASGLFTIIVTAVFDIVSLIVVLGMYFPLRPFVAEGIVRCLSMQVGAILSAMIAALVLRYCGFKLVREPRMKSD
jgi:hypothetical protein